MTEWNVSDALRKKFEQMCALVDKLRHPETLIRTGIIWDKGTDAWINSNKNRCRWMLSIIHALNSNSDDVIKWKHFPRYWPFVRGIHRSPVNSPHKGQWRGTLMFSLIYARINCWVNNREAGDLRRHRAHFDVTVMNVKLDLSWI